MRAIALQSPGVLNFDFRYFCSVVDALPLPTNVEHPPFESFEAGIAFVFVVSYRTHHDRAKLIGPPYSVQRETDFASTVITTPL
jgi:hypothetical protein